MDEGDIVIDGGNSYYIDDIRRAKELSALAVFTMWMKDQRGRLGFGTGLLHDDWRRD